MKMEDSLHDKVPKTASRATLLMGIVSRCADDDFSPQKVLDPFEANLTIYGQFRGWTFSFDPVTLQPCYLVCRDLFCANGNIRTQIGQRVH